MRPDEAGAPRDQDRLHLAVSHDSKS
jgi:hypothetical protein